MKTELIKTIPTGTNTTLLTVRGFKTFNINQWKLPQQFELNVFKKSICLLYL